MSETRQVLLILTLLASMFLSGAIGARHRTGAALLALAGVGWLLVDTSFEGVVLVDVTSHNGLTSSDLVGVGALLVAGLQLWRLRR